LKHRAGTDHVTTNGVVLQGEQDIFGKPFASSAMAALEAAGSSWVGRNVERFRLDGKLLGAVRASGSSWSGSSRSGRLWTGSLVERKARERARPGISSWSASLEAAPA
jgi:hypothetical protein